MILSGQEKLQKLACSAQFIQKHIISLESKQKRIQMAKMWSAISYHQQLRQKHMNQLVIADEEEDRLRAKFFKVVDELFLIHKSVVSYADEMLRFLDMLNNGFYIQESLDSMLSQSETQQLLAECTYQLGCMIVLLYQILHLPLIKSKIAEQNLLFTYYRRWLGPKRLPLDFDRVTGFFSAFSLASTGSGGGLLSTNMGGANDKIPSLSVFAYFDIPQEFCRRLINCVCTHDIYGRLAHFSRPEDRSAGLCSQAAIVTMILLFTPSLMSVEQIRMREIVDRFFCDNHIVSWHLGRWIDLFDLWKPFSAATKALNDTVTQQSMKTTAIKMISLIDSNRKKFEDTLIAISQQPNYILEHLTIVVDIIRESNVFFRWLFMHGSPSSIHYRAIRDLWPSETLLMDFLIELSHFEQLIISQVKEMLENKALNWKKNSSACLEHLQELYTYFAGEKPLTRVEPNENLKQWFAKVIEQVKGLNIEDPLVSGRTISLLIHALSDIKDIHQMDSNLHIRSFVEETISHLRILLRLADLREDYLVTLNEVSEFSYAWNTLGVHLQYMQESIRQNPVFVVKLRALFSKMASTIDGMLVRVKQMKSSVEPSSISQFYSNILVDHVKLVLHIIPKTMFKFIDAIANEYSKSDNNWVFKPMDSRILKTELSQFTLTKSLFEITNMVESISKFTKGYYAMQKRLVGTLEVDPRKLLISGIRIEIRNRLLSECQAFVSINSGKSKKHQISLMDKLDSMDRNLDALLNSLVMVQNCLEISGKAILDEEWTHVLKSYPSFIQSIASQLLIMTNPNETVFIESKGWFTLKSTLDDNPIISIPRHIERIFKCLRGDGVECLLTEFRRHINQIMIETRSLLDLNSSINAKLLDFVEMLRTKLQPISSLPRWYAEIYPLIITSFQKIETVPPLLDCLLRIGQVQLLTGEFNLHMYCCSQLSQLRSNRMECVGSILQLESSENIPRILQNTIAQIVGQNGNKEKFIYVQDEIEAMETKISHNQWILTCFCILLSQVGENINNPKLTKASGAHGVQEPLLMGLKCLNGGCIDEGVEKLIDQYLRSMLNANKQTHLEETVMQLLLLLRT